MPLNHVKHERTLIIKKTPFNHWQKSISISNQWNGYANCRRASPIQVTLLPNHHKPCLFSLTPKPWFSGDSRRTNFPVKLDRITSDIVDLSQLIWIYSWNWKPFSPNIFIVLLYEQTHRLNDFPWPHGSRVVLVRSKGLQAIFFGYARKEGPTSSFHPFNAVHYLIN